MSDSLTKRQKGAIIQKTKMGKPSNIKEENQMKKVMALVLAIAMFLSLASFASAEGFSGEIKIWVAEAVVDFTTQQVENFKALHPEYAGMTVIVPCDSNETRLATRAMLDFNGPCYFRTGRPEVDCVTDTIPGYTFEIGKGCQLKEGSDVTLIACGLMVQRALKAAELAFKQAISKEFTFSPTFLEKSS